MKKITFLMVILLFLNVNQAFGLEINKVIVGEDDREIVENPNTGIAYIKSDFETTMIECTGTFISEDTLLTAGHCVFNKDRKKAVSVDIFPGKNGKENSIFTYKTSTFLIPKQYEKNRDTNYDIALVKLNTVRNDINDILINRIKYEKKYLDKNIELIGYASDKQEEYGDIQWKSSGKVITQFKNKFSYELDSAGGQSGAPIFDKKDNSIIGVHTSGNSTTKLNYATQINIKIYNWISENLKN